jgi:hypothetical protein
MLVDAQESPSPDTAMFTCRMNIVYFTCMQPRSVRTFCFYVVSIRIRNSTHIHALLCLLHGIGVHVYHMTWTCMRTYRDKYIRTHMNEKRETHRHGRVHQTSHCIHECSYMRSVLVRAPCFRRQYQSICIHTRAREHLCQLPRDQSCRSVTLIRAECADIMHSFK